MPRTPPDTSLEHAARTRRAYAENQPRRTALRRGDVSIAAVMREQPAGLADRTLFEILLMAHQFGRARLHTLNARAGVGRAQRPAARPVGASRHVGAADGRLSRSALGRCAAATSTVLRVADALQRPCDARIRGLSAAAAVDDAL